MKSLKSILILLAAGFLLAVAACSSQAQQVNSNKDMQVIAKAPANSQSIVDLSIKDNTSGKEEFFKTIDDVP